MAFTTEGFRPLRQQFRIEGGVDIASSATNITLTKRSGNLQAINATAIITATLPDAAESKGLIFWISNTGTGRFSVVVIAPPISILAALSDGEAMTVACDGAVWAVLGGGHFQPGINVQTLTGTLSLEAGAAQYQRLDPGGANRAINLPSAAVVPGATFHFSNFADAAEDLAIGGIVTINQNEAVRIVSDGLFWQHLGVTSIALT